MNLSDVLDDAAGRVSDGNDPNQRDVEEAVRRTMRVVDFLSEQVVTSPTPDVALMVPFSVVRAISAQVGAAFAHHDAAGHVVARIRKLLDEAANSGFDSGLKGKS